LLMQRCVAIGNSVLGHTYPNPNVGALIYKDGKIISEGYTGSPGQNHAEINAIENIDDKKYLENSTMVVTLEPCSHYGKTPPCTKKIIESKRKGVFRIHDKPDEKKIAEIERFVKNIGYNINIINSKEPNKEINKLLALAEKKPEKNVLDMVVIRAMSKAKYSTQNIGHFGLMFENYTHFTSPIRRYPDLIVHRIINEILKKEKSTQADLENTCLHCSSMEEKATKAERASTKLMQVKYLQDKTGQVFKGVISGMNERGVFVEINDSKCEGLVKMKDIPNDFYNFDKRTNTVVGQNTLQEYVLGDPVFVKVQKTNIEKKQIDFKIIED